MNELDNKLREIVNNIPIWGHDAEGPDKDEVTETIEQIKAAFNEHYLLVEHPKQGHVMVMTGQEWYDRLSHELAKKQLLSTDSGYLTTEVIAVHEAAKCAAGLTN